MLRSYLPHRHRPVHSPNLVMEEPAFLTEVGDVTGLRVLDLGCGDGSFGTWCVEAGCRSYCGVDGSPAMIDRARHTATAAHATYRMADIEDDRPEPGSADLVVSRMALHYVEDLAPALTTIHRTLAPGGTLVISTLHPVITAARREPPEVRTTVEVDDYFRPGPRTRRWFDAAVVWHHRTIEDHLTAVLEAGFALRAVRECRPVAQLFGGAEAEFERRLRVPLFLLIAADRLDP